MLPGNLEESDHESRDARNILQNFYGYLLTGKLHHEEKEESKRLTQ